MRRSFLVCVAIAVLIGAVGPAGADRWYAAAGITVDGEGTIIFSVNTARAAMVFRFDASGKRRWCREEAGGRIVTGVAVDSENNSVIPMASPFEVVKRDPSGIEIWRTEMHQLTGSSGWGDDAIIVDGNDDVFVSAEQDDRVGPLGPTPAKLSRDGEVMWIGTPRGWFSPKSIAVDENGAVYACGTEWNDTSDRCYDEWLVTAFSSRGEFAWGDARKGSAEDGTAFPGGGVVVTGRVCRDGYPYFGVIRYGADGAMIWESMIGNGGLEDHTGLSVATDADGNVYVGGYGAAVIAKLDADGTLEWSDSFMGSDHRGVSGTSVLLDSFDHVLFAGSIGDAESADKIYVAQYGLDGEKKWIAHFPEGPTRDDHWPEVMALDGAGNAYVGGIRQVDGQGDDLRVLLLKLDSSGNVLWSEEIDDTTPCIPPEEDADEKDDDLPCGCGG